MITSHTLILSKVKADHVSERKPFLPVPTDQFIIEWERRAARSKPQNGTLSLLSTSYQKRLNFISKDATKLVNFSHLHLLRSNLNFFHVNRNSLLTPYVTSFDY